MGYSRRPSMRFYPRRAFVAAKRFNGFSPGQVMPRMSWARLRRWFTIGNVTYKELWDQEQKPDQAPSPAPVKEDAPKKDLSPTDTPSGSAAGIARIGPGKPGWWVVQYKDGTERKARKPELIAEGLISAES
jgi:hypothetical protein